MKKTLKTMNNWSMIFVMIAMVLIIITNTKTVNAETIEMEPNNNFQNAQEIVFGEQYNGVVEDVEGVDDEDYFKIVLKEGQFCKITVFNLEDLKEVKWETVLAELCTDSNTGNAYSFHASYRESVTKLFRASYNGNYYMHFYNSGKTKYSFIVEEYNPVGKMVKDSDSNLYVMGVVIHRKNVVIEKDAFKGCKNLGTLRVLKSASVKTVKKNAFKGTKKGIRIEVPNVKKYKKIFKNAGVRNPKYSKSYM